MTTQLSVIIHVTSCLCPLFVSEYTPYLTLFCRTSKKNRIWAQNFPFFQMNSKGRILIQDKCFFLKHCHRQYLSVHFPLDLLFTNILLTWISSLIPSKFKFGIWINVYFDIILSTLSTIWSYYCLLNSSSSFMNMRTYQNITVFFVHAPYFYVKGSLPYSLFCIFFHLEIFPY